MKTLRPAADWGEAGITEYSIRSGHMTPCTSALGCGLPSATSGGSATKWHRLKAVLSSVALTLSGVKRSARNERRFYCPLEQLVGSILPMSIGAEFSREFA